jgi:hypothetical protein
MTMFEAVLKDMFSILCLLFVLLLGFALAFWVELVYFPDSTLSFSTYGNSIFSAFQMSLGEQDVSGKLCAIPPLAVVALRWLIHC